MNIKRVLNLPQLLEAKSHFLLGPRQTGKSFLIHQQLGKQAHIIDLLETDIYLKLKASPWELESMIPLNQKLVVIDEVQKVPILLNEVHRLIEKKHITFLLTGSSARSLRKKDVNLLAGRAWQAYLYPLVSAEINDFDLERYLLIGGLPAVYLSPQPQSELKAYVDIYLKEEIQAESEVRNIPAFATFLKSAAITSGRILNFSKIANDAQVSPNTIREYYHILEDTLLGFIVPAWTEGLKRKTISTAKFYFFDTGIRNFLVGISNLAPGTDEYGQIFEHFIAQELTAYLGYHQLNNSLKYWQTTNGQEVDFIVNHQIALEIKATDKLSKKHTKGLKALKAEINLNRFIIVSKDKHTKHIDDIECYYWKDFIQELWQNNIVPIQA